MGFGAKVANAAELIPAGPGMVVPQGVVISYPNNNWGGTSDGGAASAADLAAAAAALPAPLGLRDGQLHQLVRNVMGYGMTWAQAKAALIAEYPLLTGALLDTYQARVYAIVEMNPPLWSDTAPNTVGGAGGLLDFSNPAESGLLAAIPPGL